MTCPPLPYKCKENLHDFVYYIDKLAGAERQKTVTQTSFPTYYHLYSSTFLLPFSALNTETNGLKEYM